MNRQEAELFIKKQMDNNGSDKKAYKKSKEEYELIYPGSDGNVIDEFHYGRCELTKLLDAIYGEGEE